MRALLVEDDPSLADGIVDALAGSAIETRHVGTGREALAVIAGGDGEAAPDIVILDLGLPDMDGTDVARAVRQAGEIPIIVISARSAELDRVLALELGADDYLVKPFGLRELLARIRAVTRRAAAAAALAEAANGGADAASGSAGSDGSSGSPGGSGASGGADPAADSPDLGPLAIDERAQRVTLDGAPLHVTPTEFELLRYLARDPGAVRRRADILRDVWHTEWFGATKTLDAHVAALRRKLGSPEWIQSVRGVGFRFEVPGGSDPARAEAAHPASASPAAASPESADGDAS